ncbi:hypothetical protein VPH35_139256 [Triticum aestivum]
MLQPLRQELQPPPDFAGTSDSGELQGDHGGECCNHDQVCWNRLGDLLEPAPKSASTGIRSFCTSDFLLPPQFCFAGTNIQKCFHQNLFFLYQRLFATTTILFCWNQHRKMFPPEFNSLMDQQHLLQQ